METLISAVSEPKVEPLREIHWKNIRFLVLLLVIALISDRSWLVYSEEQRNKANLALIDAIHRNDVAGVRAAVKAGADPNYRDAGTQSTSLWQALMDIFQRREHFNSSAYAVPVLLVASAHLRDLPAIGPSVDMPTGPDMEGEGPTQHDITILTVLLDAGVNVNVADAEGTTALMCAAGTGRSDTTALLLAHGAHLNIQDDEGRTALMWAAFRNKTETLKLLLARGATVGLRDKQGHTALGLAEQNQRLAAVRVLKQAGAKE